MNVALNIGALSGLNPVWDENLKCWKLRTSRFGTRHFYYSLGVKPAVGSGFAQMAKTVSTRKLDWMGIGGFLRFGFFPEDRTYYEDIRILEPASDYFFDESGKFLRKERYWHWKYEPAVRRSYEKTLDEFAGIFHQVIREQTAEGKIAVPISGGLDSRSTVTALLNLDGDPKRFWAYSYGYSKRSIETQIAGQIAKAAGLSYEAFAIRPYLFQKVNEVLEATEGFQDITQARQAFVTEEIGKHADAVICAHWGDVWMDSMLKSASPEKKSKDELTEIVFQKFKKNGSDEAVSFFKELVPPDLDDRLKHIIHKKLNTLEAVGDGDFKIKALKTDLWSFRWTLASIRMFEAAARPLLPFYDDRLADFFMTVPVEYVASRKLQIDYIKKYSPSLAKIKWQVYDADLHNYRRFNPLKRPARALRKIARIVTGEKSYQRNWEVQFLNSSGREGLRQWLESPETEISKYVSPENLKKEIAGFYENPGAGEGYAVSMLLTVAAALEKLK